MLSSRVTCTLSCKCFSEQEKNTYQRVAITYLLVYFFLTVNFLRKAFLFIILDAYSFSCGSVRMNA